MRTISRKSGLSSVYFIGRFSKTIVFFDSAYRLYLLPYSGFFIFILADFSKKTGFGIGVAIGKRLFLNKLAYFVNAKSILAQ
jgi:hypothetical protein